MLELDAIDDMLEDIIKRGDVPHMLIVPAIIECELREIYQNIAIYADDDMQAVDVRCVHASEDNYMDGALVLH